MLIARKRLVGATGRVYEPGDEIAEAAAWPYTSLASHVNLGWIDDTTGEYTTAVGRARRACEADGERAPIDDDGGGAASAGGDGGDAPEGGFSTLTAVAQKTGNDRRARKGNAGGKQRRQQAAG